MIDGFMLMCMDPPGLQVVVHSTPSFPLLPTSLTLCYFPMVCHRLPLHPIKCKHAEFGEVRLGPKFCQAPLPTAHLAGVLFKTSVGSGPKILQFLHPCFDLHASLSLLLMCMTCCAP